MLAGLVVDRMVTHPFEFNFYLNAHVRILFQLASAFNTYQ